MLVTLRVTEFSLQNSEKSECAKSYTQKTEIFQFGKSCLGMDKNAFAGIF